MNHMPNNLHKLLPAELRAQVENALRFPSPGLSTYAEVYELFELSKYGIEHGTVERAGRKLREEVRQAQRDRLRALRELRDAIAGEANVDSATADLLYAELFEHLAGTERDPKKIFALSYALQKLVKANVDRQVEKRKATEWAEKREAARRALDASEAGEDTGQALSRLRSDIRAIYGLGEESKSEQ